MNRFTAHITLSYSFFLGYEKGEDGSLKIVEDEAKIIRLIYKLYLEGNTPTTIARILTQKKLMTPMKKGKWHASTVLSILTNEKYKGDALLQKSYTVDFLTKETRVNHGEVPQYYVENSHEAIVSPEVFELVQAEMERRKAEVQQSSVGLFSGRLVCGDCGRYYGSKIWHSTDKYKKRVYQCGYKYKNEQKCTTPTLSEEQIKRAFVASFNELFAEKDELLREYEQLIDELSDTTELENRLTELEVEQGSLAEHLQDTASMEYSSLFERYETITNEIEIVTTELSEKTAQGEQLRQFMAEVSNRAGVLTEFDGQLWSSTIDRVTVTADKKLILCYKNGDEVTVEIS